MYPSSFLSNIHVFTSFLTLPFLFFSKVSSVRRALTAGGKWISKTSCHPAPWGDSSIHQSIHVFINSAIVSSPFKIPLSLSFLVSFRSTLQFYSRLFCFLSFFLSSFLHSIFKIPTLPLLSSLALPSLHSSSYRATVPSPALVSLSSMCTDNSDS